MNRRAGHAFSAGTGDSKMAKTRSHTEKANEKAGYWRNVSDVSSIRATEGSLVYRSRAVGMFIVSIGSFFSILNKELNMRRIFVNTILLYLPRSMIVELRSCQKGWTRRNGLRCKCCHVNTCSYRVKLVRVKK